MFCFRIRCVVSLMYMVSAQPLVLSQKSKKREMLVVVLLIQEHMGLYVCGFL